MDKINQILEALNNEIPNSLQKKVDSLEKLDERIAVARKEYESNPTDENKEALEEIEAFFTDSKEEVEEQLEDLYEARQQEYQALVRKQKQALAQKKAQEEASAKAKQEAEEKAKKEKSSGGGWGTIALGVALLGLSLGAVNILRKR